MSDAEADLDRRVFPYVATRRVRAAIGGIILAGAEIDHLISLALFKAVELEADKGFALFSKTPVTTKFDKLRYLVTSGMCKSTTPSIAEYKELHNDFLAFNETRNAVAHGVIVGKADSEIIFRLTAQYSSLEGYPVDKAIGATERNLMISAQNGWTIAGLIKFLFDIHSAHEIGNFVLLRGEPPSSKTRGSRHEPKPSRP